MDALKIAVLGAGNGGFAACVDLILKGHEVRLYEGFFPVAMEKVHKIAYEGVLGSGTVTLLVLLQTLMKSYQQRI